MSINIRICQNPNKNHKFQFRLLQVMDLISKSLCNSQALVKILRLTVKSRLHINLTLIKRAIKTVQLIILYTREGLVGISWTIKTTCALNRPLNRLMLQPIASFKMGSLVKWWLQQHNLAHPSRKTSTNSFKYSQMLAMDRSINTTSNTTWMKTKPKVVLTQNSINIRTGKKTTNKMAGQ